jgi:pimeloyl-ACP methyl ester carboxylesterase
MHGVAAPADALGFCTTADKVRLAVRSVGQGPLIIKAANWLGNVQADAQLRSSSHWVETLARSHTLLSYDARGCGLSDREVDEISLDAWVRDLEAVADNSGQQRFVLIGISQGAAIAIRYAVRHPERVRALVLYASFVRGVFHQGLTAKTQAIFSELVRIAELGWGHDASNFRRLFSAHLLPAAPADVLERQRPDGCALHAGLLRAGCPHGRAPGALPDPGNACERRYADPAARGRARGLADPWGALGPGARAQPFAAGDRSGLADAATRDGAVSGCLAGR